MINKILKFIQKNNLIPQNSKIIVGLSGGPDSIFLLRVLHELQKIINFELIAAHLNHEWRSNSYLDVELCSATCKALNIPLVTKKVSELNITFKFKGSKEEHARNLRRHFFATVKTQLNADRVALAHHLIDQEETFFIRLIRGSTLSGLTSMKACEDFYIRPLLEIKKTEILDYLNTHNIQFIIDYTNESPDFLRNRIRNNVIPELQKVDNRFDYNFLRTLTKLQETEEFLEKLVEEKFEEISRVPFRPELVEEYRYAIDLNKLFALDTFLINKLIFHWLYKSKVKFELSEKFIHEIIRFLRQSGSSNHEIHHEWSIGKKKNLATIIKAPLNPGNK
ncbi:MAG: tRNA lysidine(34) synthetase TilS [Candidatus Babeliales bacterium]|nr:tRNA lysidine(34) synthetase TilS [Candidatus Babeliales bacterium]